MSFTNKRNQLTGLYYPYASIDFEQTLYNSIIFFDKVRLISPYNTAHVLGDEEIETEIRESYSSYTNGDWQEITAPIGDGNKIARRMYQFSSEVKTLLDEGLIEYVHPFKNFEISSNVFAEMVLSDLNDKEFGNLVQKTGPSHIYISATKMFDLYGHNIYRENKNGFVAQEWPFHNELFDLNRLPSSLISNDVIASLFENDTYLNDEFNLDIGEDILDYFGGYGFIKVPSELGISVLLNHAMIASYNLGTSLFTDNSLMQRFLLMKLKRINSGGSTSQLLDRYKQEFNIKTEILTREVLRNYLPRLNIRSVDEAMEIRKKLKNELKPFRIEIAKFASEITSRPWNSDFEKG